MGCSLHRFRVCGWVLVLGLGMFPGCGEQGIEAYDVPKDSPVPALNMPGHDGHGHGTSPHVAPQNTTPAQAVKIKYIIPEQWKPQPVSSAMRLAQFQVEPLEGTGGVGGTGGEVTLTSFPGDVGGQQSNIDRWRRQMKMPAITDLDSQPMLAIGNPHAVSSYALKLIGPDGHEAMLVAALKYQGQTWFIKMTGPTQLIEDQQPTFAQFVRTMSW